MEKVIRGIWVIAYRDLLRFTQERARLVSSFAMPLLFLIIFGAGFNRVIGTMAPGVDFIQFIYPGILAMSVLMNSLMSGLCSAKLETLRSRDSKLGISTFSCPL